MKAVVVYGLGDVRYEEWEEPEIRSGCVKIRVQACGICGSDIPRVWNNGAHKYPIILGHEFVGDIIEVGTGVTSLKKGAHVVGVPLIPCMQCEDCMRGNYSQCKQYSFIGSRQQGAMADYIVVPECNAFLLSQHFPCEAGALFEPATVALHGLKIADYHMGNNVLILGGGTIGCFALQWVKLFGAKKVVVVGRDKKHLDISSELGADKVISTLEPDYRQQLSDESGGKGFDYVFETAGSTDMMQLSFEQAANKGKVCMIGTPVKQLSFMPYLWENLNRKELSLTGSWMSASAPFPGDEWRLTRHFFENGGLRVTDGMIFRKFKMRDAKVAFDLFDGNTKVKGRIILYNE